jgi:addiction module HigA family antidote
VSAPGTVLREKYLDVYQITPTKVAKDIGLSQSAVRNIVINKAKISLNIAMRLSRYFGTTVQYWVDLQNRYDVTELEADAQFAKVLKGIPRAEKAPPKNTAAKKPAGKTPKVKKAPAKKTAGKQAAAGRRVSAKPDEKPAAGKTRKRDAGK